MARGGIKKKLTKNAATTKKSVKKPSRKKRRPNKHVDVIVVKKYVVRLDTIERELCQEIISKGKSSAKRQLKARILLKADISKEGEAWSDDQIIKALSTTASMVYRVRRQLVEEGFEAVLARKQRVTPAIPRIFDGEKEAKLVQLACSHAPEGRARSKKNILKPHLKEQWVIPPHRNTAFIAAMEDVLEVYRRPRDPNKPLLCVDESSKQLTLETRTPIPMQPGQLRREDHEYERNGTVNIFMMFAPLEGWRHVEVTDRRTAIDYAHLLKRASDVDFLNAEKILLVQDNLNTHNWSSLYEAFPADEARRLVERFEWHYTPKHGSWLDMAESELGALTKQCLDRRIPDKKTIIKEIAAWERERNKNKTKADWQFTTADARVKLKRLYPSF